MSLEQLSIVKKSIDALGNAAIDITTEELIELQRVYANIEEELKELAAVAGDDEDFESSVTRYNVEMMLPTIILPPLAEKDAMAAAATTHTHSVEDITQIELHITTPRIQITDCPKYEGRETRSKDLSYSYESVLMSRITAGEPRLALVPSHSDHIPVAALPPRRWIQSERGQFSDCPFVTKIKAEEMFIDVKRGNLIERMVGGNSILSHISYYCAVVSHTNSVKYWKCC